MPRIEINYRLFPWAAGSQAGSISRGRLLCGAGVGRSGVDQVGIRNGAGMPYIPGSTIKGVLREKCVELCRAAGLELKRRQEPGKRPGHLHAHPVVDGIFGAPFQSDLCSVFEDLQMEGEDPQAIARVVKRIQMDRRLGRPAQQRLFDVEYAVCGAFRGRIHLWREGEAEEDPGLALLLGALRLLRSIGGHRSTGAGLFRAELLPGRHGSRKLQQEDWEAILLQLGQDQLREEIERKYP